MLVSILAQGAVGTLAPELWGEVGSENVLELGHGQAP